MYFLLEWVFSDKVRGLYCYKYIFTAAAHCHYVAAIKLHTTHFTGIFNEHLIF